MKRWYGTLTVLLLGMFLLGQVSVGETELLQTGSQGEEVVRVQQRLFDLGYYFYKPDGSYEAGTRTAVIAYKTAAGILGDSSIGGETLDALYQSTAVRAPFHAVLSLSYTAQGTIQYRGEARAWNDVRARLTPDVSYTVRNAATGETCQLLFVSGVHHAVMRVADTWLSKSMMQKWLGTDNSQYKCAVLLDLDGQWIAASMQWDGEQIARLYFSGSTSDVYALPDVEHAANIKKASN